MQGKAAGLLFGCTVFAVAVFSFCRAQEEFKYDAQGKRNPFLPLVTDDGRLIQPEKGQEKKEISLEGIIYDKYGVSYAIVNGFVVKTGDSLGDHQILKIEKNKVLFIKEGQVTEVILKKEGP